MTQVYRGRETCFQKDSAFANVDESQLERAISFWKRRAQFCRPRLLIESRFLRLLCHACRDFNELGGNYWETISKPFDSFPLLFAPLGSSQVLSTAFPGTFDRFLPRSPAFLVSFNCLTVSSQV